MKYLSNLSIKIKVLVLFLLPTIALMYQILNIAINEMNLVAESEKVYKHVELSVAISSFVHESQKERGATAGFISSKGKKFSTVLLNQRKDSDKKLIKLKEAIISLPQGKETEFRHDLNGAMQDISQLSNIRTQIDSLTIEKSKALAYYANMHKKLLDTIASISKESSDVNVVKSLNTYINFLCAKEIIGVERAVSTSAFASKDVSTQVKIKIASLLAQQQAFMDGFNTSASKTILAEYTNISNNSVFVDVDTMINILLNATDKEDLTVDPLVFYQTIAKKINLFKTIEDKLSINLLDSIESTKDSVLASFYQMLILNLLLTIFIVFLGIVVIKNISKNVTKLQLHMKKIHESNDLTLVSDIDSKDEIGQISFQLNDLILSFGTLVSQTKHMSNENASIAHELSTTAIGVGDNVESSVVIVEEATSQSQSARDEILSAITDSQESKEDIIKANDNLGIARDDIVSLTSKVQDTAQVESELAQNMEELSREANDVKGILVIIGDIADQTNLLALNAAIEAARAGEHGRGFAVVADEVRKLAERTQKTLLEINATINVVVQSIGDASNQMSNNSEEIQKLANIAQGVEDRINFTVEIVNKAVEASDSTVKDFEDTGIKVGAVIEKIENINEISSTNARNVEEIAAAAEHLNELTNELNSKLETFKT